MLRLATHTHKSTRPQVRVRLIVVFLWVTSLVRQYFTAHVFNIPVLRATPIVTSNIKNVALLHWAFRFTTSALCVVGLQKTDYTWIFQTPIATIYPLSLGYNIPMFDTDLLYVSVECLLDLALTVIKFLSPFFYFVSHSK